jgi:DNA-binding SARP family transcriptional activator/streptogramin lyase
MEFRILGALEVEDDGRVLKLGGAKQRALLAYLLLHANEAVSRERLIDELWGDEVPGTAATAVQVHVSHLRKALGHDVIVTQPPGYLVRVGDGELDLARFEALVVEARQEEPTEAAERLRAALALWRGPPLAEFDGSFARTERARLEEQRLAALERRIDADLELGRHRELMPELEALVREEPLREHLRGQLMLALYRCGRQAEALEVFRSGRRLLDEELGLEPGEELRRLERAILEHDPLVAAPSPDAARPPPSAPMGTVTFLFTDIEGSTSLVQELGDEYGALLAQHHALLRSALGEHGGEEIDRQGDAFFFAFRRARDAVRASVAAQLELSATGWPKAVDVHVRIGVHTGEPPGLVEGGYHGLDVVRAARISGAAHGGQILVSSATRDLTGDAVPGVSFVDLGEHQLKDLGQTQRLFQVVAPGLREEFPPLRTEDAARVMSIGGREEELAVAAEAALESEERRVSLFRRSRVIAVAGALILAAAAAFVAFTLARGSSTTAVTIVPDSVVVFDPAKQELKADVPIGGRPVGIAVGEGGVWVTDADDGTVTRIDPRSHAVVKTIGLGADVNYIAVGFGSVWVAGGNDETLYRIDPRRNAVQAILRFGRADPLRPQPVFFIATGDSAMWITRGNTLIRIDPATDRLTARTPLPSNPVDLGAGAGNVWVTTGDERLLRIDQGSATISDALTLPSSGASPVVHKGALWLLVYTMTDAAWELDPSTLSQSAAIPFPPGYPFALATDGGRLWAIDRAFGSLMRIHPAASHISAVARLGYDSISVAAGENAVWIGVQEKLKPPSGP